MTASKQSKSTVMRISILVYEDGDHDITFENFRVIPAGRFHKLVLAMQKAYKRKTREARIAQRLEAAERKKLEAEAEVVDDE